MRTSCVRGLALLLATCAWWMPGIAAAAEMKPVAVVALAGYDRIKADVALVGKLSDNPDLDKNLEAMLKLFTRNKGLAGIDKARPWGAVVQADGESFIGYAFLPVTDLKELLGVLTPLAGEPKDAGDGVRKFDQGGKAIYFKEVAGGWLLVADKIETLGKAPADPAAAAAGLNKQYDVAARIFVRNLPAQYHEQFQAELKRGLDRELKQRPNEGHEEYAARTKLVAEMTKSVEIVARDLDQITVGWSMDPTTEATYLDVSIEAKPGSELAQDAATMVNTKTNFAGFQRPQAAISGGVTGQIPASKAEALAALVEAARSSALAEMKRESEKKSEEEQAIARGIVAELFDVAAQTVKDGRLDARMSVALDPQALTVVGAMRMVGAPRLEKVAKQLAELIKKEKPEVAAWIKFDVAQYKGVALHTLTIPLTADVKNREQVVKLVGENIEVVVGLGLDGVCHAVGRDAMGALKKAIDESQASQTTPPLSLSVAFSRLAEFVAEVGEAKDRPRAEFMAKQLAQTPGKDHITIVGSPIPNGVRYRLEIEPGLIRLIGKAGQMPRK